MDGRVGARPFVERTANRTHSRYAPGVAYQIDGEEIRPPHRFKPGVCPCGTVLSTYNPHTLCAVCRTKALRANHLVEFKDRRQRDYGVQAVSGEHDGLHQPVAVAESSGGSAGTGARQDGCVPEGM